MKVSIYHGVTKAEALAALEVQIPTLMARLGLGTDYLQHEWQDHQMNFSLKAMGFAITGVLSVDDKQVEMDVNLPIMARPMEGQIRDRVNQVMQEIFGLGEHKKEHHE